MNLCGHLPMFLPVLPYSGSLDFNLCSLPILQRQNPIHYDYDDFSAAIGLNWKEEDAEAKVRGGLIPWTEEEARLSSHYSSSRIKVWLGPPLGPDIVLWEHQLLKGVVHILCQPKLWVLIVRIYHLPFDWGRVNLFPPKLPHLPSLRGLVD